MLGGGTDSFGASCGVWVGVSAQRGDEVGHLLVALDPAEGALRVEHAGGGPAQHHLPSRQRVTFRFVAPAMEIIDSIGFELVNVFARVPVMPSRATVNSSGRPSRRLATAPGCLRSNAAARAFASRNPAAASALF